MVLLMCIYTCMYIHQWGQFCRLVAQQKQSNYNILYDQVKHYIDKLYLRKPNSQYLAGTGYKSYFRLILLYFLFHFKWNVENPQKTKANKLKGD